MVTIPKEEYNRLKSMGEMELIGEANITSTSDKISLSNSIENYRFIYLEARLNGKTNNDWIETKIIPAKLNTYVTIILNGGQYVRINTLCISEPSTISVTQDVSTVTTWKSTYVMVYGVK